MAIDEKDSDGVGSSGVLLLAVKLRAGIWKILGDFGINMLNHSAVLVHDPVELSLWGPTSRVGPCFQQLGSNGICRVAKDLVKESKCGRPQNVQHGSKVHT